MQKFYFMVVILVFIIVLEVEYGFFLEGREKNDEFSNRERKILMNFSIVEWKNDDEIFFSGSEKLMNF